MATTGSVFSRRGIFFRTFCSKRTFEGTIMEWIFDADTRVKKLSCSKFVGAIGKQKIKLKTRSFKSKIIFVCLYTFVISKKSVSDKYQYMNPKAVSANSVIN